MVVPPTLRKMREGWGTQCLGWPGLAGGEFLGGGGHLGGAVELVPGEGLAVDGALDGLEEDDREDLAIAEALDPDVEEQPAVTLAGRVLALEGERQCRGDEVDHHKGQEEAEQLVEAGGGGG